MLSCHSRSSAHAQSPGKSGSPAPPEGHAPCQRLRDTNSSEIAQFIVLKPCPSASSPNEPKGSDRKGSCSHPAFTAPAVTPPLQQRQGHHTQLLRHLLSPRATRQLPNLSPLDLSPCGEQHSLQSFPPPKQLKLSSLPAQGHGAQELTTVKCHRQGTAHGCKRTHMVSQGWYRAPCARAEMYVTQKSLKPFLGSSEESPFLLGTMLFTQAFSWGVLLPFEKATNLCFYG